MPKNVEIKAKVHNSSELHRLAKKVSCSDGTIINQEDIFFNVPHGRLKFRKILDEKDELIFYTRPDQNGPKVSSFKKVEFGSCDSDQLKDLLSEALGIKGQVIKKRTLYIVGQTRIHVDEIVGLGHFMELEVKLEDGQAVSEGEAIAKDLMEKLNIQQEDLIDVAYVDLLIK